MSRKKSICVFCGASSAVSSKYLEEGKKFGNMIAERGHHMVFGGGSCGVMGAVAGGVLERQGTVTGVYPRILNGMEDKHDNLTEMVLVDDMHTRKMNMFNKSDVFVILPGGFGTMDETFEVVTWRQLNMHDKPIILYNYEGYWDGWIDMTDRFIECGFASSAVKNLYGVADSLDEVFAKVEYGEKVEAEA